MVEVNQLEKIEALLRKAESTEFPEEAQALTAKAEALMTKWAIDAAMLRQADTTVNVAEQVTNVEIIVWSGPTLAPLAMLLYRIVDAHNAQSVYWDSREWNEGKGKTMKCRRYKIYGMPESVQAIQMLYASLQIQAANEYASDEVQRERPPGRGPGFKNSFMTGFAVGIGLRLKESRQAEIQSSGSTALVLVDEAAIVKTVFESTHTNLGRAPSLTGGQNGSGFGAGMAASERVSLGGGQINA